MGTREIDESNEDFYKWKRTVEIVECGYGSDDRATEYITLSRDHNRNLESAALALSFSHSKEAFAVFAHVSALAEKRD